MNDANDPLLELKHALKTLSPHDLAAWTEQMENRLTERLRQRQDQRRPLAEGRPPMAKGRVTDKEPTDA